ncbi:hypothetical protein QFC24_001936 [Naganishia onofrii]|uniref:Uncharacterized protein n=1 Tax=Naganishia onofrii TaxID=1851511 RepID=A0ACC2XRH2_9TREE|nr:hypothetical protein QFC24_001936 [Naganishia onofrii]
MTFFHTRIIHWLTPAGNRFRALKGGWAIPIAIIFVLIVLILVGVVWGLGEGFGIAAAGTILAFHNGSSRLSAFSIQGEISLADYLAVGLAEIDRLLGLWLPVLEVLYCIDRQSAEAVGVVLAGESSTTKSSHVVSDIVWAVTAVVSIGAGWYIWWKMSKVRIEVWREMRDEMALKGVPEYELPPQVDAEGHVVGNNDYRGYNAHDGAHPLPSA